MNTPNSIKSLIDRITTDVKCDLNCGFIQKDKRLNRTVKTLVGYNLSIDRKDLDILRFTIPNPKFRDDWKRMYRHYKEVCRLLIEDIDTRRAVILNTHDYDNIYECFLLMHVTKDRTGLTMVVYQRACDLTKLIQDLIFFAYVIRKIEKSVGTQITTLLIRYGHIHKEIT